METEDKELDEITQKYNQVKIGTKMVSLNYPMRAWRVLNKEYGGMDGLQKEIKENTMTFILDKLSELIFLGLVDKESVTKSEIQEELDNNNITELKDGMMKDLMLALSGTLPVPKAGKKGNPQKAEK